MNNDTFINEHHMITIEDLITSIHEKIGAPKNFIESTFDSILNQDFFNDINTYAECDIRLNECHTLGDMTSYLAYACFKELMFKD